MLGGPKYAQAVNLVVMTTPKAIPECNKLCGIFLEISISRCAELADAGW
jgi:hypothetical protein